MYFIINERLTGIDYMPRPGENICIGAVFTPAEWELQKRKFEVFSGVTTDFEIIRNCKLEDFGDCVAGTFSIPDKKNMESGFHRFGYCFNENMIVFIDKSGICKEIIDKLKDIKKWKDPSIGKFFYTFLESIVEKDLMFLEEIGDSLSSMEEEVLKDEVKDFNQRMLRFRKNLMKLSAYYEQLSDLGEELLENPGTIFTEETLRLFKLFTNRVARFGGNVHMLQEYSMQLSEIYETQVDIKLNSVMKTLTVITSVFLPLTLLVGWYGMNFRHMPELEWWFGYPMVFVISILIAAFCIWIFKKKKLL